MAQAHPGRPGERGGRPDRHVEEVPARAFVNGRVYTQEPAFPWATGLVAQDGRVLRLLGAGDTAPPGIDVVDLGGRLVLPGFTDAHTHLTLYARNLDRVALSGVATLEQALERVRAAALLSGTGWILGQGWDPHAWGGLPERRHLDRAAPGRPIALQSRDCHSSWLSSAALAELGIDAATPDPPAGRIVRDSSGEPTGILLEAATKLAEDAARASSDSEGERLARLGRACREALSLGITGVHVIDGLDGMRELEELARSGDLPLRTLCYALARDLETVLAAGWRSGDERGPIRFGGLKLFTDGALGSRTALLSEPYEGTAGEFGIALLEETELAELAKRAVAGGLSLTIHAIGDRANTRALDVLEAVVRSHGRPVTVPHRIEHAQLVFPADVARFGSLGVVASVQPCHIPGDWVAADRHWGDRSRYAYPFRRLLATGARLALGSDVPVEGWNPFRNLYAAVARRGWDGEPGEGWYPGEALSLPEAIQAYTVGSASAGGEQRRRGRLAPGMDADFVALSRNLFELAPREWLELRADLTVVAGEIRHRSQDMTDTA